MRIILNILISLFFLYGKMCCSVRKMMDYTSSNINFPLQSFEKGSIGLAQQPLGFNPQLREFQLKGSESKNVSSMEKNKDKEEGQQNQFLEKESKNLTEPTGVSIVPVVEKQQKYNLPSGESLVPEIEDKKYSLGTAFSRAGKMAFTEKKSIDASEKKTFESKAGSQGSLRERLDIALAKNFEISKKLKEQQERVINNIKQLEAEHKKDSIILQEKHIKNDQLLKTIDALEKEKAQLSNNIVLATQKKDQEARKKEEEIRKTFDLREQEKNKLTALIEKGQKDIALIQQAFLKFNNDSKQAESETSALEKNLAVEEQALNSIESYLKQLEEQLLQLQSREQTAITESENLEKELEKLAVQNQALSEQIVSLQKSGAEKSKALNQDIENVEERIKKETENNTNALEQLNALYEKRSNYMNKISSLLRVESK